MYRVLAVFVLVALFFVLYQGGKEKEDFKVLGALAPQKDMYWQCLSDCERGDPAMQLTKTKGSMSCLAYCDSTITDIVRRGGPSYPKDEPVATVPIKTRINQSYAACGDGTKGAYCRKNFATDGQIDQKCRQDCAYSTLPADLCMRQCSDVLAVNKSSGWSWK
jgi:hypothetical protein